MSKIKERKRKRDRLKPLSLYPLKPEVALRAFMEVSPKKLALSSKWVRPEYGGRLRRNDRMGVRRSLMMGRIPGETLSFLRKQESRNPGRWRIPGSGFPRSRE